MDFLQGKSSFFFLKPSKTADFNCWARRRPFLHVSIEVPKSEKNRVGWMVVSWKKSGKTHWFFDGFYGFLDCSLIVFTMKCRMLSCNMVPFSLKLGLRDRERAGFGILVRGHSL